MFSKRSSTAELFFNCWVWLGALLPTFRDILNAMPWNKISSVESYTFMVFLVVMCRCESWTIKNADHQRINAFLQLWCWRRLLRVPWTVRRSNQSILSNWTTATEFLKDYTKWLNLIVISVPRNAVVCLDRQKIIMSTKKEFMIERGACFGNRTLYSINFPFLCTPKYISSFLLLFITIFQSLHL